MSEIREKVISMKLGENLIIEKRISTIKALCLDDASILFDYKIVQISEKKTMIICVKKLKKYNNELIHDCINMINFEFPVKVDMNIQYVRTLISRFNKENNREITVSAKGENAYLNEVISMRNVISKDDKERYLNRLNELIELISDKPEFHERVADENDDII